MSALLNAGAMTIVLVIEAYGCSSAKRRTTLIIAPAHISVPNDVFALCLYLQLDSSSLLTPCSGPSRRSETVKTSSIYCTIVQYLAPLWYSMFWVKRSSKYCIIL
jgi:hypothetical protein